MTIACTINSTGITQPTYKEITDYLTAGYQGIFGTDINLDNDSMDGQLLQIFAKSILDVNNATVNVYNSFTPAYAQGEGLSSLVKINGISRLSSTFSTCNVDIVGVAGTIITNGIVQSKQGDNWNLTTPITIPLSGTITVLATAQNSGSIPASIGDINKIVNPTLGWQSVINSTSATEGNPVETDYTLRKRQTVSTTYPALSVTEGVSSAVANVIGVTKSKLYENDTNITDSNGLTAHSIASVTIGGNPFEIASAIARKKSPGCSTIGTSTQNVPIGNSVDIINFYIATERVLKVVVNIHPLTGYSSVYADNAKANLKKYVDNLDIADDIYLTALISEFANPSKFNIVSMTTALDAGAQSATDKTIAFNEIATLVTANITVNLV